MKFITLAILVASFMVTFGEKVRYDYYRMFTVHLNTEKHLKIMQDLEVNSDGIKFMDTPNKIPLNIDIIVPPHKLAYIDDLFAIYNMNNTLKVNNLQKLIDAEQSAVRSSEFTWNEYNDLSAFYKWMDDLLESYPKIVKGYTFGESYEKRPLRALKISHKEGNPAIFIESNIHAREWITSATASFFINELLTSSDDDVRKLANNYDWVIVPVFNVDGFDYTHTKDRMWRKNLKPSSSVCIGTDLNRNFDFHHAESGASTSPCAETFAGPKAFSEPETLALSKFITTIENLKLYISFHSYSQLLMFPYGHSTRHAPNFDDMLQVGEASIKAIEKRYGTKYETGSIAETIYLASGSSIDWVYGVLNVSLTYTFEFRDRGQHGFILPPDQIIPNSLEVIDGLKAMVDEAESLHYL